MAILKVSRVRQQGGEGEVNLLARQVQAQEVLVILVLINLGLKGLLALVDQPLQVVVAARRVSVRKQARVFLPAESSCQVPVLSQAESTISTVILVKVVLAAQAVLEGQVVKVVRLSKAALVAQGRILASQVAEPSQAPVTQGHGQHLKVMIGSQVAPLLMSQG